MWAHTETSLGNLRRKQHSEFSHCADRKGRRSRRNHSAQSEPEDLGIFTGRRAGNPYTVYQSYEWQIEKAQCQGDFFASTLKFPRVWKPKLSTSQSALPPSAEATLLFVLSWLYHSLLLFNLLVCMQFVCVCMHTCVHTCMCECVCVHVHTGMLVHGYACGGQRSVSDLFYTSPP